MRMFTNSLQNREVFCKDPGMSLRVRCSVTIEFDPIVLGLHSVKITRVSDFTIKSIQSVVQMYVLITIVINDSNGDLIVWL